jgi:hypothetical protein
VDAAITVAAISARQFDDVGQKRGFIVGGSRRPALRRAMVSECGACAPLRNIQLLLDVLDAGPATGGA